VDPVWIAPAVFLLVALVVVSRRWGPPRLHRPVTLALWAAAALVGVLVLRLWLE
jgi:hypothetical protein